MTKFMNYCRQHYRITDVLQVEARLVEIAPEQGLLEDACIARTVAWFGFTTTWV